MVKEENKTETGYEEGSAIRIHDLQLRMNQIHLIMQNIATGVPEEININDCLLFLVDVPEVNKDKLRSRKNRAMAAIGIASLYAASGGLTSEQNTALREDSLCKLENTNSLSDLEGTFYETLKTYASQVRENGSFSRLHDREKRIVDYIIEHVNEKLSLNETAKIFGEDPDRLSKNLKSAIGYSFPQLVAHSKITKAKGLLQSTDRSVTEIAYQLSFSSPGQFATVFRRETGFTPREYRIMKRKT